MGAIAPLTSSATGFVFAAYLPPEVTAPMLALELEGRVQVHPHAPASPAIKSKAALETITRKVRSEGLAYAESLFAPGVNSYAAPVFDHGGKVMFAISVIGYAEHLGTGAETPVSRALVEAALGVSASLGYRRG